MNSFFSPILTATVAGLGALPFSGTAAGLLFFTAAIGAIIRLDYSHRYRGLRVPRHHVATARDLFRAATRANETHRLAA